MPKYHTLWYTRASASTHGILCVHGIEDLFLFKTYNICQYGTIGVEQEYIAHRLHGIIYIIWYIASGFIKLWRKIFVFRYADETRKLETRLQLSILKTMILLWKYIIKKSTLTEIVTLIAGIQNRIIGLFMFFFRLPCKLSISSIFGPTIFRNYLV